MKRETIADLRAHLERVQSELNSCRRTRDSYMEENKKLKQDLQEYSYRIENLRSLESQVESVRNILGALGVYASANSMIAAFAPVDKDLLVYLFEKFGVNLPRGAQP